MNHLISLASLVATPATADPLRDSLSLHNERWFVGVFICGFVVALGCAAEVPETWATWKRWRRAKADLPLKPEDEKSWHRPAAAVGLLFVILGILGETICEGFVSVDETSIRAIDEGKLGNAIQKASDLDHATQGLKTEADTQRAIAATALENAGKANVAAEKEKVARLELEKQIAPRALLHDDRIAIAKELSKFAPDFAGNPIKIDSLVGDPEGLLYALAIGNILDRAGIPSDSTGIGQMVEAHGLQFGVVVTGPSQSGPFIKSFVDDVNAHSKSPIRGEWKPSYTETIIFVGVKPIADMQKLLDTDVQK